MEKKRVIRDYEKLTDEMRELIKLAYPNGYSQSLIRFTNKNKKRISVLPFETEDTFYLVKMTMYEAQTIIEEDDDYDEDGILRDEPREEYMRKYTNVDDLNDIEDSNSIGNF